MAHVSLLSVKKQIQWKLGRTIAVGLAVLRVTGLFVGPLAVIQELALMHELDFWNLFPRVRCLAQP